MIALTSISPNHFHPGIQEACVRSWIENGLKVFSVNGHKEVDELEPRFLDVTFIGTGLTFEHDFGKPYVALNAVLDFAKEQEDEHILLLNSDIFLHDAKTALEEGFKNQFSFAHRLDVKEVEPLSPILRKMEWGIDIFLVNKSILSLFPLTSFAMGLTHWDYWFPYYAAKRGIKPVEIKIPFAYHKEHPQQWSNDVWLRMGQHALWLTGYDGIMKPKEMLVKKDIQRHDANMMKRIKFG